MKDSPRRRERWNWNGDDDAEAKEGEKGLAMETMEGTKKTHKRAKSKQRSGNKRRRTKDERPIAEGERKRNELVWSKALKQKAIEIATAIDPMAKNIA